MLISNISGHNKKDLSASLNIISVYDAHYVAPHRHIQKSYYPSYNCVIYTVSGRGRASYNDGSKQQLDEHDLLFSTFNNLKMLECLEGDWHFHIIWFQASGFVMPINKKINVCLEDAQTFIDELLTLLNQGTNLSTLQANCRLLNRISDYLVLFDKYYPQTFLSKPDEIIEYIHNNLHTDLKIKDIAARFYLCPKQIRNIILKKTGLLPKEYILSIKLNKACKLLVDTTYTLDYIASALGFFSTSHFMHAFKKIYNMTPIQYRDQSKHTK